MIHRLNLLLNQCLKKPKKEELLIVNGKGS